MDSADTSLNQSSITACSGFDASSFMAASGFPMMAMQPFSGAMSAPQQRMWPSMASQQFQEQQERTQHILGMKLGPEFLAQRAGAGGGKLTYIEGWRAINIANEVFGYNGWSSETKSLEVDFIDQDPESGRFKMGVTAIVRVQLRDGTFREDCGYGKAEGVKSKGDALEKCKKEAITDATKRALRTFGNLLGNCLYDKNYVSEIGKMKAPKPKFSCSELYRGDGLDNVKVPRRSSSANSSASSAVDANSGPSTTSNSSSNVLHHSVVPAKRPKPSDDSEHTSRLPPPQRQQSTKSTIDQRQSASAIPPHMRQNNEKQQQKASPQTPAQQSRSQQTAPTSRPQQQPEQQPVFNLPDGDISEIDYSEGMDDALFAGVVAEDAGLMPDQGQTTQSFRPMVPPEVSHPQGQTELQSRPQVQPVRRPSPQSVASPGAPRKQNAPHTAHSRNSIPPPVSKGSGSTQAKPQRLSLPPPPRQLPTGPAPNPSRPPPAANARPAIPPISRAPPPAASNVRTGALPNIRRGPPAAPSSATSKAVLLDDFSAGVQSPPDIETFGADAGFGSARRLKRTYSRMDPHGDDSAGDREPFQTLADQNQLL